MALLNIEFRDSRMKVGESVMNTQSRGEVFGVSEHLTCDFLTIMEPDSDQGLAHKKTRLMGLPTSV